MHVPYLTSVYCIPTLLTCSAGEKLSLKVLERKVVWNEAALFRLQEKVKELTKEKEKLRADYETVKAWQEAHK